jgi:quercetin dioxygenase-like cupin family protein
MQFSFWKRNSMSTARKLCLFVCGVFLALGLITAFHAAAPAQAGGSQAGKPVPPSGDSAQAQEPVTVNPSDLEWFAMVPQLGKNSPVQAVLHEHPENHSRQFLIRMPPNFHVPAHFHSANETHTVIEGSFIIQVKGKRVALSPGGFNYTPARVVHEAWTPPDKGALIFVTIDGPYDLLQEQVETGQPAPSHR